MKEQMEDRGRNQLLTSLRSLQSLRPPFDTQSTSCHTDTETLGRMFLFALDMVRLVLTTLAAGLLFSATRRDICTCGNFLPFLSCLPLC